MYKDQMGGNVNGTFHQQYLTALNNLTALCLEKASVQEAVSALWRYCEGSSIRLSVRLSNAWIVTKLQTKEICTHILVPNERSFSHFSDKNIDGG